MLAGSVIGCGGPDALAPANPAVDIANVNTRLQGTWRLVDFKPDVQLEPMLAMWLQGAKSSLYIKFDGGSLQADAPNAAFAFHYDRPFTISDAGGDDFTLTTTTQGGDTLVSRCQFTVDGNHFQFHSQTEPLRGVGTLERAAAAPANATAAFH